MLKNVTPSKNSSTVVVWKLRSCEIIAENKIEMGFSRKTRHEVLEIGTKGVGV